MVWEGGCHTVAGGAYPDRELRGVTPIDREAANQALRQLQVGDRSAATAAFELLWPVMLSFSQRVLKDSSKAQDVAQEALMKLFEQVQDFRKGADAVAWALEIAAWECRTELRRNHRQHQQAQEQPGATEPAQPDSIYEAEELRRALGETVAQLSEPDRQLVEGILQETYPPQADAALRKRKERALLRLRQLWRSLYGST